MFRTSFSLGLVATLTLASSYASNAAVPIEGGFSSRLAPLGASLKKGKAHFEKELASTLEKSRSEAHAMIDQIVDEGDLEAFLQAMGKEGDDDLAAQLREAGPDRARTLLHSRLERRLSKFGQEIQATLAKESEARLQSSFKLAYTDLAREETNLVETLAEDSEDSPQAPQTSQSAEGMPMAPSSRRDRSRRRDRPNQARNRQAHRRDSRTIPLVDQQHRVIQAQHNQLVNQQRQLMRQQQVNQAQQQRRQIKRARRQQRQMQQQQIVRQQQIQLAQQQQFQLQQQRAQMAANRAAQQAEMYRRQALQRQAQRNMHRVTAQNVYNQNVYNNAQYQASLQAQNYQQQQELRRARRAQRRAQRSAWLAQQQAAAAWAERCNRFDRFVYSQGVRQQNARVFPAGYYYRPDRVENVIKRGLWGAATVAATPFALLAAIF